MLPHFAWAGCCLGVGGTLHSPGADSDGYGQIWNQMGTSGGLHPGQPSLPQSCFPAADPDLGLLQPSEVCVHGLREVLAASQGAGPCPAPRGWGWVLGFVTGRGGGSRDVLEAPCRGHCSPLSPTFQAAKLRPCQRRVFARLHQKWGFRGAPGPCVGQVGCSALEGSLASLGLTFSSPI